MDGPARFHRLLTDLSTRFAGVAAGHVDAEVDRALAEVVEFLGTDRSSLLEILPAEGVVAISHNFTRAGLTPALPATRVTGAFPWYHQRLRAGDTLRFDRTLEELPVDALAERTYAARLPMLSHVAVPLRVGGNWVCALLTSTATRYRSWTDVDVERIRIIGQVLANAVHRRNLEAELRASLAEVRELHERLQAENRYLRESYEAGPGFEEISGRGPAIRETLGLVAQVAPMSTPVLLLGETGTGKELIARAIHGRSRRSARALIKVNCAALPASLVESELFGHEKGAFTGATATKPGRFELADGGTLFLDEVGEIQPDVQVKLLRVLQDGEFERVGAIRSRKVDVRIVAATNRDLEAAMAEGRFREDLYYRLAAFPIRLPPLRDRREDIPHLVWELIRRRQDEFGRRIDRVPEAAMQVLMRYAWPGNVRELANVIERAMILSSGPVLQLAPGFAAPSRRPAPDERLEDVERSHLIRILDRCQWRITGAGNAAELLGMNPSTLRSRLKKLGVTRPVARHA